MSYTEAPLLSIIIPVHNAAKEFSSCLESIKGQKEKNFEVILINDGSTDESGIICDNFARENVDIDVCVIHQEKQGPSVARNNGMKKAKGKYITFLDSDDYFSEHFTEMLVNCAEKENVDIVHCAYSVVNNCGIYPQRIVPGLFSAEEMLEKLCQNKEIKSYPWGKIFRRELFAEINFPEGRWFEDLAIMYKVFMKAKWIYCIDEIGYFYCTNPNGTSCSAKKNVISTTHRCLAYIERYIELSNYKSDLIPLMLPDLMYSVVLLVKIYDDSIQGMCEYILHFFAMLDSGEILGKEYLNIFQKKQVKLLITSGMKNRGIVLLYYIQWLYIRLQKMLGKNLIISSSVSLKEKIKKQEVSSSYVFGVGQTDENEEILKKLHSNILDIIKEIDRICTKYGLCYYIYGGTFLGAVRHKGFIPWDDDADIVMPRQDYERFAQICQLEFGDKYFYQNCFNKPDYSMLFAKVCKNGTYIDEDKWKDKDVHKGIFVDILPLDYFPKSKFLGKLVLHLISFLQQVCAYQHSVSKNVLVRVIFVFVKKLPRKWVYFLRDFVLKFTNEYSSKEYICSFGSHYQPSTQRVFRSDWFFGDERRMEFEGIELRVPSKGEEYLFHLFGKDYMSIPPQEQRFCHTKLTDIRFEDGYY